MQAVRKVLVVKAHIVMHKHNDVIGPLFLHPPVVHLTNWLAVVGGGMHLELDALCA